MSNQDKTPFSLINKMSESIELEKSVLGFIILDGFAYKRAAERINEHDFMEAKHKTLFRAFGEIIKKGSQINAMLLSDHLKANDMIEKVGGREYLVELYNNKSPKINFDECVKQIKAKSVKNKQRELCVDMLSKLNEDQYDTQNDIDVLISQISKANQQTIESPFEPIGQISEKFLVDLALGKMHGIPSGFPRLDEHTCGLMKQDLVVISAETGVGKTTLAWQIALNLTLNKVPVAYASLEMSKRQMMAKAFSVYVGKSFREMINLSVDSKEMAHLKQLNKEVFAKLPMYFSEKTLDIFEIKRFARVEKQQNNIELLIIDHLHFIQSKKASENRTQEVSNITKEAKALAKELDIPIILLSQMNKANVGRSDRTPQLTDMKDSTSIQQDADTVLFIYRPGFHKDNVDESPRRQDPNFTEFILRKNRCGEINIILEYEFDGKSSQFKDPYHQEEQQVYEEQQRAVRNQENYCKD
jgi:replicative DNA helicase